MDVNQADEGVLWVWRARCPELRALWNENEPVTAWAGVTFGEAGGASQDDDDDDHSDDAVSVNNSDAGRVVQIKLERKGLTGDVPAALGGLTALRYLDLSSNRLTSVPAALGGLTALIHLNLTNNRLTSVPEELGGLTALTELWLNNNRLTSVPAALGGLTALMGLGLGGNRLTSVPAEWEEGGTLQRSGCDIDRHIVST